MRPKEANRLRSERPWDGTAHATRPSLLEGVRPWSVGRSHGRTPRSEFRSAGRAGRFSRLGWSALAGVIALLQAGALTVHAQAVPAELRAAILLRAVAYERNLAGGDGAVPMLVVRGSSGSAAADGRAMENALQALAARVRVAGRPLQIRGIELESPQQVASVASQIDAQIVYLPTGLEAYVRPLAGLLGRQRRMLACGDPSGVTEGCVLSVEAGEPRARVVIHLRLAQALGLHFDARLLQLSRIVR